MNRLYYGDCLTIMREMERHSVDLIYLDPPCNSNREYNAIYKGRDRTTASRSGRGIQRHLAAGRRTRAGHQANADPHAGGRHRRPGGRVLANVDERSPDDESTTSCLPHLHGRAPRPHESDPKADRIVLPSLRSDRQSHIKVMLDGIWGHQNFRNEVVWKRTSAHGSARRFGPIHDVVLFYSGGPKYTWNPIYEEYDPEYIRRNYRLKDHRGLYRTSDLTGAGTRQGESGQPWRGYDPTLAGRHWAVPRKTFPDLPASPLEALDELARRKRIRWPKRARKGAGQPSSYVTCTRCRG